MRKLMIYEANDKSRWDTERQALTRDKLIEEVDEATAVLGDRPEDLNWDGYIQHDLAAIRECRKRLFKILERRGNLGKWIKEQCTQFKYSRERVMYETHVSWFIRLLDGRCEPLEYAYTRLYCIDDKGREWEQPYYAVNPGTGKDKEYKFKKTRKRSR